MEPQPRPAHLRPLCLAVAALLATVGCGEVLSTFGVPSLHEWSSDEAVSSLEQGTGQLVQAGPSAHFSALGLVAPLTRVDAEEPIPTGLLAYDGWLLVLADDRADALATAARLSRAGAPRVAIVAGDLERLAFARLSAPMSPGPGSGIEDPTP